MSNDKSLARGAISIYDAAKLRKIAKNSNDQLIHLEKIREQGEATIGELSQISAQLSSQIDIQERQLLMQEKQAMLAEQSANEKSEQKVLKKILFAFKMDFDGASQISYPLKNL